MDTAFVTPPRDLIADLTFNIFENGSPLLTMAIPTAPIQPATFDVCIVPSGIGGVSLKSKFSSASSVTYNPFLFCNHSAVF